MSIDNQRICIKCNKVLHDKEGYCSKCGKLSGKPLKGTILIRSSNILPAGLCLIIIGVGIIVISGILHIKGAGLLFSMKNILFGLGLPPIILGYILIKKQREFRNIKKAEIENDINSVYCKYCYTVLDPGSNYCYFCGSKDK